jgi:hypothetical protein
LIHQVERSRSNCDTVLCLKQKPVDLKLSRECHLQHSAARSIPVSWKSAMAAGWLRLDHILKQYAQALPALRECAARVPNTGSP